MSNDKWARNAIQSIVRENHRTADTHLFKLPTNFTKADIYLKDESTHPTGNLKHRLAASLFLHALCNGRIHEDTTVFEESSGNTAISEAYFAQLIGVKFIAVVDKNISDEKKKLIKFYGGRLEVFDSSNARKKAIRRLKNRGYYFMNQFKYAEQATDWRGNNNIAETIFSQLQRESNPIPDYIVVGAGTGGTSATIGRYIRYKNFRTKLVVVDPYKSAFFGHWEMGVKQLDKNAEENLAEGIGRPRVEKSFLKEVIDDMKQVSNREAIASMLWLHELTRKKAGPSTGSNIWGSIQIAMENESKAGAKPITIVTLMCDGGEIYPDLYDPKARSQKKGLEDLGYETRLLNTLSATNR